MNRQQAADAAGTAGLLLRVAGNDTLHPAVTAISQSAAPGQTVPAGTVITVEFADHRADDP